MIIPLTRDVIMSQQKRSFIHSFIHSLVHSFADNSGKWKLGYGGGRVVVVEWMWYLSKSLVILNCRKLALRSFIPSLTHSLMNSFGVLCQVNKPINSVLFSWWDDNPSSYWWLHDGISSQRDSSLRSRINPAANEPRHCLSEYEGIISRRSQRLKHRRNE